MSFKEFKEKAVGERSNDTQHEVIWYTFLLRMISVHISRVLVLTPISPNLITLFGALCGIVAGYFYSRGSGWPSVIGSLFLFVAIIFDCCDGEVARFKNMSSITGLTFDMFAQLVVFIAALFGIAVAATVETGIYFGVYGFFAILVYTVSSNLSLLKYCVAVNSFLVEQWKPPGQDSKINCSGVTLVGSYDHLRKLFAEFLKTPNQYIFFFVVSFSDALELRVFPWSEWGVSNLFAYFCVLSGVWSVVFLTKMVLLARGREVEGLVQDLRDKQGYGL